MIKMLRVSTEVPLSQQSRFSSHVYFLSILSTGGVQGDGHCEARRISLSSSGLVFSTAFAIINKPGPTPTQADWDAAFEFPPVEEDTSFAFLVEDLARKAAQTWALITKVMPGKE